MIYAYRKSPEWAIYLFRKILNVLNQKFLYPPIHESRKLTTYYLQLITKIRQQSILSPLQLLDRRSDSFRFLKVLLFLKKLKTFRS